MDTTNNTLYLFVDESGNFDFSPYGSKHFLLTVLSLKNPTNLAIPLLELRYEILKQYSCGKKYEENGYFHATEDTYAVRDLVINKIKACENQLRVDCVYVDKRVLPEKFKNEEELYTMMGKTVLNFAFKRIVWRGYKDVVVVFSSLFNKRKRGNIKQVFKAELKKYAEDTYYSLYFHDSKFDFGNQAVDYFCWSIARKIEKGDTKEYDKIKKCVKSEFQLLKR